VTQKDIKISAMKHLIQIEQELKKRLDYPYRWGKRQTDDWDKKTNFIYRTPLFNDLLLRIDSFDPQLKDYAMNRWYNFWSAQAVERIFAAHPNVTAHTNPYDKRVDFYIDHIPFDHKTSVFPKGFNRTFNEAVNDKRTLIEWLYRYQSQQGRKHLKNRLFIVLYDTKEGQHWRLKSHIRALKKVIDAYVSSFSKEKLVPLHLESERIYSDCIWFME